MRQNVWKPRRQQKIKRRAKDHPLQRRRSRGSSSNSRLSRERQVVKELERMLLKSNLDVPRKKKNGFCKRS